MESKEFFLDRDNDGHWYLIPEEYRIDWYDLFRDDSKLENGLPTWLIELGCNPNLVKFKDPILPNGYNICSQKL